MTQVNAEPASQNPANEEAALVALSASPVATEELAHLKRMSGTGSAFGQADYVAINPTAIASLILGFATLLSAIATLFLFIPLVGLVCGILAIRQIRNSNGTQSGTGLAIGGIALCLLIGGGVLTKQAMAWSESRAQSRQCAQVITRFSDEFKANHDDVIYQTMTTSTFQAMTDYSTFHNTLQRFRDNSLLGKLVDVRWNGEPMEFQSLGEGYGSLAYAMAVFDFDQSVNAPARQTFRLSNREGDWKIDGLPQLFVEKKNKGQDQP